MSPGETIWDTNKTKDAYNEFERLLAEYDYKFSKGDIVKGIVIAITPNGALVDIGAKTTAFLPQREIGFQSGSDALKTLEIGVEKEFFLLKEEDDDEQLTVSIKRVALVQNWSKLEAIQEQDSIVEAEVASVVKGGVLVDVLGLRGFVPASHLRLRDPDALIGEKIQLKILSMDAQKNNLIMSQRKAFSGQQAEQRKDVFEKLKIGDVVEGEVVRLAGFGAFVDLGGIDGLLPLSQMSWRWVDHPADLLKVGERIKVEVIGVDEEKHRVSLSLKTQQPDPWGEVSQIYKSGQAIKGKVTRIKHFGAFVEVYAGVEALLPSKELFELEKALDAKVAVGDEVETFIVRFVPEDRRMSLSYTGQDIDE